MNSRMEEEKHYALTNRDKAAAEFFKELTLLLKLCEPLIKATADKVSKEMKNK